MKLHNKDTGEDGRLMMCHDYDEFPFFIEMGSIKIYYHNFAGMIEAGWDCVKIPAEPLIKDEKIRKAVRAWAKVNSIEKVIYAERPNRSLCCFTDMGEYDFAIEFVGWIPTLKDGEVYSIAELCGEGEE